MSASRGTASQARQRSRKAEYGKRLRPNLKPAPRLRALDRAWRSAEARA